MQQRLESLQILSPWPYNLGLALETATMDSNTYAAEGVEWAQWWMSTSLILERTKGSTRVFNHLGYKYCVIAKNTFCVEVHLLFFLHLNWSLLHTLPKNVPVKRSQKYSKVDGQDALSSYTINIIKYHRPVILNQWFSNRTDSDTLCLSGDCKCIQICSDRLKYWIVIW